jgi:predicted dinucleotide-binding enzyme
MSSITIIGAGNMGTAIAGLAAQSGANVQVLARDGEKATVAANGADSGVIGDAITGDIVVLALPYPAVDEVLGEIADALAGKVVVDITNPLDFATFDGLVVPSDGSAASEIARRLPSSHVLKAFNTNFAATLATRQIGDAPTTVLIAGDDADAKAKLAAIVDGAGLTAVDAGSLKRAREVEAIGFLQLTLAAGEKINWTGGFAVVK